MTAQSDHTNKSLFQVQIEPSIREGEVLVPSSLTWKFDERPALIKERFPPANTTPPVISGPTLIPGEMYCDPGQWLGSPGVQFQFQWMSNGIDIPGATQQTWISSDEYSDTILTCEVRGFNPLGEDYAISNAIEISSIYPINIEAVDFGIVTGMKVDEQLVQYTSRAAIVSGLGDNWDETKQGNQTVMRAVAWIATGMAAPGRFDMVAANASVITGLGAEGRITADSNEVMVISRPGNRPLLSSEVQYFQLKNPYGELGMAGWTNVTDVTTVLESPQSPDNQISDEEGHVNPYYSFFGGYTEDPPYQYAYQDVPVETAWETTIDGGSVQTELSFWQYTPFQDDMANMRVEYLDESKTIISSNPGPGLITLPGDAGWIRRYMLDLIPPNTRFVRIYMEFFFNSGINIDAYIDGINMAVWTGNLSTSRDFGPTFQNWRIRFTQARSWPGCALSEIEMRNVIGGTDLTTPDTNRIIGGSEALGGNKNFAFDNLRNTGYWAGDLLGISQGTSWLGYEFPNLIKPGELDITARTGSNALQMGQAFVLEGQDTGTGVWYKVQNYDNIPEFAPGERKRFPVLSGAFPWIRDNIQSSNYNTGWDKNLKGNIYQSKVRMNLEQVAVRFQFIGFDYEIAIVNLSFAYDSRGVVTEILSTQQYQSTVGDWEEITLPAPIEFEVDDQFAVLVRDIDRGTSESCRIWHFQDVTYTTNFGYSIWNNLMVNRVGSFYKGTTVPVFVGLDGDNPANNPFWAMDLKGTIF